VRCTRANRLARLGVARVLGEELELGAHRGHWRAQLVGGVGGEALRLDEGAVEAGEELAERAPQRVHLLPAFVHAQLGGSRRAVRDGGHRAGEARERLDGPRGEAAAGEERDEHREEERHQPRLGEAADLGGGLVAGHLHEQVSRRHGAHAPALHRLAAGRRTGGTAPSPSTSCPPR
jgi:hypothetical protein